MNEARRRIKVLGEFKYPEEHGLKLPIIVLGIKTSEEYPCGYEAKKEYNLIKIKHQTAGHGCHQLYLFGSVLEPKNKKQIEKLANYWFETDEGVFGPPILNSVLEYRKQLKKEFGVDCNECYADFSEASYPIDCNINNISKIAKNIKSLPEDFDEMLVFNSNLHKLCGMIGRWSLFILGKNCD